MGGNHAHHAAPESRELRRLALLAVAPFALLTLVALVWLWPDRIDHQEGGADPESTGEVVALHRTPCEAELADDVNGCGTADIRLDEPLDGQEVIEVPLPNGAGAPEVDEGDDVVVTTGSTPTGPVYTLVDHQRGSGLWVLGVAFALALVAFGRWRGLTALLGLAVTFALLLLFVVPAILGGTSPLLVALVGSAAIVLAVLYLTHGFALSTTVALLGTLASLALTAGLAVATLALLHLTGVTDDATTQVAMVHGVNTQGLLVAGIIIGSLGVLDDVTVTQAVTVTELARANPSYRFRQLYGAGSRVGRAHIASVVNTIVLAYAGSSLPVLILMMAGNDALGGLVTTQVIAEEIARSAVATLGLVAAVPVTTALAALVSRHAAKLEHRN